VRSAGLLKILPLAQPWVEIQRVLVAVRAEEPSRTQIDLPRGYFLLAFIIKSRSLRKLCILTLKKNKPQLYALQQNLKQPYIDVANALEYNRL
jgi:hypothetical protein